jgi:hypothetical protein
VGVSESPDQLADRRRDLRARLAALDDLGGEPLDHPEQLGRVFAGADRLMAVVDGIEAVAARRRRWLAYGLLVLTAVLTGLVAFAVLPAFILLVALLVLVAAVGLLLSTRDAPAAGS